MVKKKMPGPQIYDLTLNIIILAFLIAIIVLLVKCQRAKRENFESVFRNPGKENAQWREERFFRRANFTNPVTKERPYIATAPIHQNRF